MTPDRCDRCDARGLVWFRPDGTTTTGDDPEAVRGARCRHPRPLPSFAEKSVPREHQSDEQLSLI